MASAPFEITSIRSAAIAAGLAALLAAILVLFVADDLTVAAGFLAAGLIVGGGVVAARLLGFGGGSRDESRTVGLALTLARALAQASDAAVAVTDRAGRLVCANDRFDAMFGGFVAPPGLPIDEAGVERLGKAGRAAWRDGEARATCLRADERMLSATVTRAGAEDDMLVWRFDANREHDLVATIATLLTDEHGDKLGGAGVMEELV